MLNVSLPAAALGGLISFLSPCVLPLVPPYLSFLAGTTFDQLSAGEDRAVRRRAVLAALLFVAGFSTVFVLLGATASALGQVIRQYLDVLSTVAGLAIIVMGLHFLGVFRIGLLYREARFTVDEAGRPLGRLRDGPRLRVRLDALHRPGPGGDPGGGGLRERASRTARCCSPPIRSVSAFRSCSPRSP